MKINIFPLFFLFLIFYSTLMSGHGMNEVEKELILEGSFINYMFIGITHMVTGYDHLLFIFGVVFLLNSFTEILKYVTIFTLGHSITLVFATFNGILINYFLIDAFIALSVCFIGLKNLGIFDAYLKKLNIYYIIFIFGLVHGLGLSTRLQELVVNKDNLLFNILSFNLGIEIGQLVVLVVILFLFKKLKTKVNFNSFSKIVNIFIIVAGIYFFTIQINDYLNSEKILYQDKLTITIPAKSDKEHKFWLEKDKKLKYSWTSSENIYYDFHGEPSSDTTGYFKSYKEGTSNSVKGELIAPFMGTHGWYWKNSSSRDIVINLKTSGEYKK